MRAVDIIIKKRDGLKLSAEEIRFFIDGVVARRIPDYQAAAWLMAVYHASLDFDELAALTRAMIASGEQFDLSTIPGVKVGQVVTVDKHSTGGVGDKVSLILAPLAAAAGARVPMVAGRGLGHTGGTLDKLESIPGFRVRLSQAEFVAQVARVGCAIAGQTDNFVPADKILYALRDVTGTVESIPLIAASILSKKFASGTGALVMDVKTGSGAFMRTEQRARELAETLRRLGEQLGRKVVCLITDMSQPLGEWIGNRVEVIESINVLRGAGDAALRRLCLLLGAWMLRLARIEADLEAGQALLERKIASGEALGKFAEMVAAQGGDPAVAEHPERLEIAANTVDFRADKGGFVSACDAHAVGVASMLLGAGREKADDAIDPAVGIRVFKRIGDAVEKGEPLMTLLYNDEARLRAALTALAQSVQLAPAPSAPPPLVKAVLD